MRSENTVNSCLACPVREEQFFCHPSLGALERLNKVKCRARHPEGARLFHEGQMSRGVFVLCTGTVKLFTASAHGKNIITRIAHAGDVLGLNAVISGRPYGVSAEMMEPGEANFIPRESLLAAMKDDGEVAIGIAKLLSAVYFTAHEEVRILGLATSVGERLAQMLLSWSSNDGQSGGGKDFLPVRLTLTQEEIGETIGATRECVGRLLSEFSKRQMLQLRKSVLWIQDRPALEKLGCDTD